MIKLLPLIISVQLVEDMGTHMAPNQATQHTVVPTTEALTAWLDELNTQVAALNPPDLKLARK